MKQPMAQQCIVGIGEILWDMLPQGKSLGGAPANFAYHAQALGGQATVISALGRDPAGLEIRQQLAHQQMTADYIQANDRPTGWVDLDICQKGHPTYRIHEDVAWDYLRFSSAMRALAQTCDAVCFGTLAQRNPVSRQCIRQFLAATKKTCLRVFDINLRQNYFTREIIDASLRAAAILKLNDSELDVLRDMFDLRGSNETALRALLEKYQLDFIAFTHGASGSMMVDRTGSCCSPGVAVAVNDTVGAGDSFTAAMVLGRLHGLPLEKINRLAGKVAAYVCSQAGATPKLPADLIAELKQEMPMLMRKIKAVSPSGSLAEYSVKTAKRSVS